MVKTHVYYGTTPYHVILLLSIALQNKKNNHYLLLAPGFPYSNQLIKALSSWDKCPFEDIFLFKTSHNKSLSRHWILKSKQSIRVRQITKSLDPDRVFITRDKGGPEQALLHYTRSRAEHTYVEDGIGAYSSTVFSPKPLWKKAAAKIFYGYWWEPVQVLGTSRWIDNGAFIFPTYVRPELRQYPNTKISSDDLARYSQKWLDSYLSLLNINATSLKNVDILVILTHSNNANTTYKYNIQQIINRQEGTIGVKYHPRETATEYFEIEQQNDVRFIPQSIPAELIYYINDDLKEVIGAVSTALLTARWIDNSIIIKSYMETLDLEDDRIKEVFSSLGVSIQ